MTNQHLYRSAEILREYAKRTDPETAKWARRIADNLEQEAAQECFYQDFNPRPPNCS